MITAGAVASAALAATFATTLAATLSRNPRTGSEPPATGSVGPSPTSPNANVAAALPAGLVRRPGPSGSLLVVESNRSVPLVRVIVASRSGSAADPRHREGLTNLAAEWALRGAAGRTRAETDAALDALGATLEVETRPDSTRFQGEVLARNLPAYLALLGDIIVRPTFAPAELLRTRREVLARIDEDRTDDRQLCARYFARNVYGDHPYGHPPDGLAPALEAARPDEVAAHFRRHFGGHNLVFALAGDVDAEDAAAALSRAFRGLDPSPAPAPNALELREPVPPKGWRIQLVDKPDRQQSQLMFGHPAVRAADPDYLPLTVALSAFGGQAMNSTMMDEVRRKRGLAYGAYLTLEATRGVAAATGWAFSAADKTVATLKLALKLYVAFMENGLSEREVAFFRRFAAGIHAAEMDDPEHRLDARVSAEMAGLPPDFVDGYGARVQALSAAEVNAAIKRRVRARDLAITIVASAATMKARLVAARIQESAIDVVPYDHY